MIFWLTVAFGTSVLGNNNSELVNLSKSDTKKLIGGEIVITESRETENTEQTYSLNALINAPIKVVYDVIVDYESYNDFMPNIENVEVTEISDSTSYMDYTILLPLNYKKYYRVRMLHKFTETEANISWKLVKYPTYIEPVKTIRNTTGYWTLSKYEDSDYTTLLEYHIYTDPGEIPFGCGWIVDFLTKQQLPNILNALRNRVSQITKE